MSKNLVEVVPTEGNTITILSGGCQIRLSTLEAESVYRYVERQYRLNDAETHIRDLIDEYDDADEFKKAYGVMPEAALGEGMYEAYLNEFIVLEDCNSDENTTWKYAIENVLEDLAKDEKSGKVPADESSAETPVSEASNTEPCPPIIGEICTIGTPLGEIVVSQSGFTSEGYPGFIVDLRRKGCKATAPLAMVEFTPTEGDLDNSAIITRVWDNVCEDEYQTRVVHQKLDEFFADET